MFPESHNGALLSNVSAFDFRDPKGPMKGGLARVDGQSQRLAGKRDPRRAEKPCTISRLPGWLADCEE